MQNADLRRGDCLEVMQEIPEKSIDLILCDLPYGATECEWDKKIHFATLWEQYERIIKDRGAVVLFAAQPFTAQLITSNKKLFRYCWYWKKNNKTGFAYAKVQPMRCIEEICVFYKKAPTYNPQGLKKLKKPKQRKFKDTGKDYVYRWSTLSKNHAQKYTNYPSHLLEFANEATSNKKRYHPTQKPVALLEYLIKTYTHEGETVLDNCMGSGSTGVACINTNRRFIGIERDGNYFKTAVDRIKTASERNENKKMFHVKQ